MNLTDMFYSVSSVRQRVPAPDLGEDCARRAVGRPNHAALRQAASGRAQEHATPNRKTAETHRMSTMTSRLVAVIAFAVAPAVFLPAQTTPGDWPQWRGPDRTGVSRETGLLQEVAFRRTSRGVVGERSRRGLRNRCRPRHTRVRSGPPRPADDASQPRSGGRQIPLWSKTRSGGGNDRGSGPRSTPTLDGDRVYVLTETGELFCLREDGAQLWQRNILREFSGSNISWLLSESPLVDGDRLIVTPGGRQAGLVALDKMTGKTIWAAKEWNDDAGYPRSSP